MTIKEENQKIYFAFFETLRKDVCVKAKRNYLKRAEEKIHHCVIDIPTLSTGFVWSETPEKGPYWNKIYHSLVKREKRFLRNNQCSLNNLII